MHRSHRSIGVEDPGRTLDRVIYEMNVQLIEAKKQVCVAIADEHRLRRTAESHRTEATSWEQRAMLAVRAGDDGLARAALLRKGEAEELATTYEAQWLEHKRAVDTLREALHTLDRRIHDATRQRAQLIARMNRAYAQRTIAATLAHMQGYSPWAPLERMEDRVMQLEAEVDAVAEIGGSVDLSLEAQFAALEARTRVDEELEALKRRLAPQRPRRALPPGLS
jgi:phage shock protein A